jgi:hypothetical protein
MLQRAWAGPVSLATLGGLGPRPADVVTPDSAVSPYLLAPGFFADRLRESCASAYAVADVLGPHPELVALVAERTRELDRLAEVDQQQVGVVVGAVGHRAP